MTKASGKLSNYTMTGAVLCLRPMIGATRFGFGVSLFRDITALPNHIRLYRHWVNLIGVQQLVQQVPPFPSEVGLA